MCSAVTSGAAPVFYECYLEPVSVGVTKHFATSGPWVVATQQIVHWLKELGMTDGSAPRIAAITAQQGITDRPIPIVNG